MASKDDKVLIIGIGNTILSDDAIGIIIAKKIYDTLLKNKQASNVECVETSYAGWRLIDLIAGYKRVIIIDAIQSGGTIGECYKVSRSNINSFHLQVSHGMDLETSLELAKKSGMDVPEDISIYAVEVKNPYEFGEKLSPEIAVKIPEITKGIIHQEFILT